MTNTQGKRKLFIFGDAGVHTGFANVVHNLVEHLHQYWDISILALNYLGDPHPVQKHAQLYNPAAKVQGDLYGSQRIRELIQKIRPDVIFIINDPWICVQYVELLRQTNNTAPIVLYTPVDATQLDEEYVIPLNGANRIIAYTEFGKHELTSAGLKKPIDVIPHGIDTTIYKPIGRTEARSKIGIPQDWFIVNVTDRNQIRKRIDLALYAFSEWVKDKPLNIKLHYHGALMDEGWDIMKLAKRLGLRGHENTLEDRLIITSPDINSRNGVPLDRMPYVYGIANVGLSTTLGEGWAMTVHERMAMRIPMIVPRSSALSEWPNGGVHYIETSPDPFFNIHGLNTRGAVPIVASIINGLERLYTDAKYREKIALDGYRIATDKKYKWENVAKRFNEIFLDVLVEID